MQSENDHRTPVMVMGGGCNTLGILRGLGRRGIPMILLNTRTERNDMVRYSRYACKKLTCPDPKESEAQFVNFLLDFGRQMGRKCVIIPHEDTEVMALCRHAKELEPYYLLPMPTFETIQKLVNKKLFYKLLDDMSIPHPKTYFPEDITELRSIGREIDYPYIIKPAYSQMFAKAFRKKCFLINASQDLDQAADKLSGTNLEVVIQEIIPGNEIYTLYTYFNRSSEPVTVFGYDKVRQFPVDFGVGTLCKSMWLSHPSELAIKLLKAIEYHGIAEPEFKKDPRDGEYKLLEINARATVQNRLPAACGLDNEYMAYLEVTGQYVEPSPPPNTEVVWLAGFYDLLSCLQQLTQRKLGIGQIVSSLKGKRIYSVAAWDDPVPFLISPFNLSSTVLKFLLRRLRLYVKSKRRKDYGMGIHK